MHQSIKFFYKAVLPGVRWHNNAIDSLITWPIPAFQTLHEKSNIKKLHARVENIMLRKSRRGGAWASETRATSQLGGLGACFPRKIWNF